jgi:tetratricopeptide (TPR) repeat protein
MAVGGDESAQLSVDTATTPALAPFLRLPPAAAAALATLVLAVGVWAVYGKTLRQPFVFDDRGSVLDNTSITRLRPLWGDTNGPGPLTPRNPITGGRPLVNLSLAVNYRLGGLNPAGYHAFNVIVHLLSAILLWAVVSRTLRLNFFGAKFASVADPLALLVALVWALHPLQTECVAYVTQRTELMMGLFFLATLYASLRYWSDTSSGGRATWLTVATLACLLGMCCKEVMVTAPALVLLFERTFVAGSFRRAGRESWPLYVGLLLGWGLLLILNIDGPRSGTAGFGHGVPAFAWWFTEAKVLLMYLKLTFWPWPLVIHYEMPRLNTLAEAWPCVLPVALLGIATVVCVARRTAVGFLGAWLFVILSPTLVVPMTDEVAAERRMYLPLAAIAALVVVGGYTAAQRANQLRGSDGDRAAAAWWPLGLTFGATLLAVAILALLSARRVAVYDSPLTLWQDALLHQADDPIIHANLGAALNNADRPQEAIPHFQEAIRLKPGDDNLHYKLGLALVRADRLPEAIQQFEEALRIVPGSATYHHVLGSALVNAGRPEEGIAHFREVLRIDPRSAETHQYLAAALLNANQPQEAITHFEQALQIGPDSATLQRQLAFALAKSGQAQAAARRYEQSLRLGADTPSERYFLAKTLAAAGQLQAAIAEYTAALRLAPDAAPLHYDLALALLQADRQLEAIEHFTRVERLRPDDVDVRMQLATTFAGLGRTSDAITAAENALKLARSQGKPADAEKVETLLAKLRQPEPNP